MSIFEGGRGGGGGLLESKILYIHLLKADHKEALELRGGGGYEISTSSSAWGSCPVLVVCFGG